MVHRLLVVWLVATVGIASAVRPAEGRAQDTFSPGGLHGAFVGSEMEQYLRVLQVAGVVRPYPWSIRGFSPAELDRLAPGADARHPWASRYALEADTATGVRAGLLPVEVGAIYNSSFPYGFNDGAVWAGRGVTGVVQAGGLARWGPVSVSVAPVAFYAQNAPFELDETGEGVGPYADPKSGGIDRPQRFGDGPYGRVDLGQTSARVDLPWVTAGVSSANQHWGPVVENPLILGSHAPGFAHAFLGTRAPVNLFVGRTHARIVWGGLDQSAFAPPSNAVRRRLMSGVVAVFLPRGLPGLEVGVGRFFHSAWPDSGFGVRDLLTPFRGVLKTTVEQGGDGSEADAVNQLATVFFRWVVPSDGAEIYGEFARDDHSWDLRDLLVEPDHLSGYSLGFRKVWRTQGEGMLAFRGEVLNTAPSHLRRVRHQGWLYAHSELRQGHTHRGQVLGSDAAYGGGGAGVVLDRYSSRGRWSVGWTRIVRQVRWAVNEAGEAYEEREVNVINALGVEALIFAGPLEITAAMTGAYELDRGFGEDVWNTGLELRARLAI